MENDAPDCRQVTRRRRMPVARNSSSSGTGFVPAVTRVRPLGGFGFAGTPGYGVPGLSRPIFRGCKWLRHLQD